MAAMPATTATAAVITSSLRSGEQYTRDTAGIGTPQNYTEALKWYRKAAEQGDADAQYNLGVMCRKGHCVPQNDVEAVKWYRKAAEQGLAQAQNNLGFSYLEGKGVPQVNIKAFMWLSLAKAGGHKKNYGKAFKKN